MSLFKAIHAKWNPPSNNVGTFTGLTVIVTGANVGLGYEAALKYVQLGASTVILAVRTLSKGETAKSTIEAATGKTNIVQVWELDMDSFSSVRAFAKRVETDLPVVDVALLNAGVQVKDYKLSPEGWEETLQVNVLATTLLGTLLITKLKASKRDGVETPHLDIVASSMSRAVERSVFNTIESEGVLKKYNTRERFSMFHQYSLSKLLVMYSMVELAQQAINEQTGEVDVIVNACCPGATRSDLANNIVEGSWFMPLVRAIFFALLARTTEQGSRTLVSSTSLGVEGHGKFWENDKICEPVTGASNGKEDEIRIEIWKEIEEAVTARL